MQQFAHGDVPQDSSSFVYCRGDDGSRSIAGTMLLGNESGSGCAVLALLLCLIDGGDLPAHSLEIAEGLEIGK